MAWFLGRELGLLVWLCVVAASGVLVGMRRRKGRWMAWVALGLSIVHSLANAIEMGHLGPKEYSRPRWRRPRYRAYATDSFGVTVEDLKAVRNETETEDMNLAQLSRRRLDHAHVILPRPAH